MFKAPYTVLLIAMLFLGITPGRAASPAENRAFQLAAKSYQDMIYDRAEDAFAQFLQRYPKSEHRAEAVLYQAISRYFLKNYAGAITLLTENQSGVERLADEYQFWIAEALLQKGDFALAAKGYHELWRQFGLNSPRGPAALFGEAAAGARLQDWKQVVTVLGGPDSEFKKLAALQPANTNVLQGSLLLAEAAWQLKDLAMVDVALQQLQGQRLVAPMDWRAERMRCLLRLAQRRFADALGSGDAMLSLATNSAASQPALLAESVALKAEALEGVGRRADAAATLQQNLGAGIPTDRQQQALLKITELALAEGHLAEASSNLLSFLNQTNNPPGSIAVGLLSLGEIHLRQAAGLVTSTNAAALAEATNHLSEALGLFEQLVARTPESTLIGRAELNRGWCFWLRGQLAEAGAAFETATQKLGKLGDTPELAAAWYKLGDVRFMQTNYAPALQAYQSAQQIAARLPGGLENLGPELRVQELRSSLALTNLAVATSVMNEILDQKPRGEATASGALFMIQGLAELGQPEYEKLLALAPDFPRRSEVELALGRAREQRHDLPGAIASYEHWLEQNPTNGLRPQVEYSLAWVHGLLGNETNALEMFTNFVARHPTNELAAAAQWWVADWYFTKMLYPKAEESFKAICENMRQSQLVREARMMAGRAAMEGGRYQDAIGHFTNLTSDALCELNLRDRATLAYASALMLLPAAGTNAFANIEEASRVLDLIRPESPTNEMVAQVNLQKAKCYLQQPGGQTNAWATYSLVVTSAVARVDVRSEAQVGRGQLFESLGQPRSSGDTNQEVFLKLALADYLDVLHEANLRPGETPDPFYLRKAGVAAGALLEALGQCGAAEKVYVRLRDLLPALRPTWDRKIAQVRNCQQNGGK